MGGHEDVPVAVKRPSWTMELGEAVLAYVRATVDFGLHYPLHVPVDSDPDLARLRPRRNGTLEVLVDASFSPRDSHSISGTVILLAGCPVQWESKKQSLMALSTAEAELTALVEGLQAGRSVRALAELLLDDVHLGCWLITGSGGGWRTRHLHIRASCLAEAVSKGELTLSHRVGTSLWADALTKSLPAQRFCKGVFLCHGHGAGEGERTVLSHGGEAKLSRCKAVMLAGASMLPQAVASEVCEKEVETKESPANVIGDLGWFLFLAGLVCLLHVVKDVGIGMIKKMMSGKEEVKVKLLSEEATVPKKGSEHAAGWDLSTSMACQVPPGARWLISTGVAIEIPKSCYGRIASRS